MREGSGGPSREPGLVGRAGRGQVPLPEGWEGSGGPPIWTVGGLEALQKGPEGVRSPSRWPGGVGRGRKTLPKSQERVGRAGRVWESLPEALPEGWEGSGGPPEGPGVVRRPSQRAGRGWEALLKGVGRVETPYRRAGRGWEALLESQERLGGPGKFGDNPRGPRGGGRPFQKARRDQEVRERLGDTL